MLLNMTITSLKLIIESVIFYNYDKKTSLVRSPPIVSLKCDLLCKREENKRLLDVV